MSDEALRALERADGAGDLEATSRLKLSLRRVGRDPYQSLAEILAAHLHVRRLKECIFIATVNVPIITEIIQCNILLTSEGAALVEAQP